MKFLTCFALAAISLLAHLSLSSSSTAHESAENLVSEALHREIYGLNSERSVLLSKAMEASPEFAPARWHAGMIQVDGQWMAVEDSQPTDAMKNYAAFRLQQADTLEGNLALAEYCSRVGLQGQRRAHLTRVLELDGENQTALRGLGYQLTEGGWQSGEAAREEAERNNEDQKNFNAWQEAILAIRNGITSSKGRMRFEAKEAFAALDDPTAIPAMELYLTSLNAAAAIDVADKFAQWDYPRSSRALATLAIYSPWLEVREYAARKLSKRDPLEFAPEMLGLLHTPVTARSYVIRSGGRLLYQKQFTRESQDENELLTYSGGEQELINDFFNGREAAEKRALRIKNLQTQNMNERVAHALNLATGQQLPANPELWWTWWNQSNEIYVEGEKPIRDFSPSMQLVRLEQSQDWERRQQREEARRLADLRQSGQFPLRKRDCLAAGSQVWTASGPQAVETLTIGDQVLSQHPETGELAFKTIMATTVRPPTQLIRISFGDKEIVASGGHPFWVAGEGWVKARDLASGMELHGLRGARTISALADGPHEESYNLIVDDFNTYFVAIGDEKVLSHDNSLRKAVATEVPGLKR